MTHVHGLTRAGIPLCRCGSGRERHPLLDARGIFCTYVCGKCETRERRRYRPEIFYDSDYYVDEPIEPDEDTI